METLIAFIWGMITVFYIGMVVVVVQMRKTVKELESQIRDTNEGIQDVYKQLKETEASLIRYNDELDYNAKTKMDSFIHNNESNMNELYRYIDSRFDKFENKITNKKEILKG
jgi:hypothetical protein